MNEEEIITAVLALKPKNCEGYDRIPQRGLKKWKWIRYKAPYHLIEHILYTLKY